MVLMVKNLWSSKNHQHTMAKTYIEHGRSVRVDPDQHGAIAAQVDKAAGTTRSAWVGERTISTGGLTYTGEAKPSGADTITFTITKVDKAKAPAPPAPVKVAPKKDSAKKSKAKK